MESALFAVNLVAMVYLCFWALRKDSDERSTKDQ